MSEVEVKRMPKFKRCKITQQQLSALMANFGAMRSRISTDECTQRLTTTHSHARGPPIVCRLSADEDPLRPRDSEKMAHLWTFDLLKAKL